MSDTLPYRVNYGDHTPSVRPANGVEGILCSGLNGRCFLRVHDISAPDGFVDYDLRHGDLAIRVIDCDAAFYDFADKLPPLLDHAPATLGLTDADLP